MRIAIAILDAITVTIVQISCSDGAPRWNPLGMAGCGGEAFEWRIFIEEDETQDSKTKGGNDYVETDTLTFGDVSVVYGGGRRFPKLAPTHGCEMTNLFPIAPRGIPEKMLFEAEVHQLVMPLGSREGEAFAKKQDIKYFYVGNYDATIGANAAIYRFGYDEFSGDLIDGSGDIEYSAAWSGRK